MKTRCPICMLTIRKVLGNRLVEYHIRYEKPIVILACKFCNYVEFQLRNKIEPRDTYREKMVRAFHKKFGISFPPFSM